MNRELNSDTKRFQRFYIYKRGVYSLLQIHFFFVSMRIQLRKKFRTKPFLQILHLLRRKLLAAPEKYN